MSSWSTAQLEGGAARPDAAVGYSIGVPADPKIQGRYVLLERIGQGGMGRVHRAYDAHLRREVALKQLWGDQPAEAAARLVREAQSLARLSHPNIVTIFDAFEWNGRIVLVMELVRGTNLEIHLRAESPPWRDVLDLFIRAGRGLAAAHAADVLHRDFKPANVLLGPDRVVKVADFGLAKSIAETTTAGERDLDQATSTEFGEQVERPTTTLTRGDVVMGTPAYMAPEQHLGQPLNPSADQYALCVAMWRALTGRMPFDLGSEATMAQLTEAKLDGPPAWPTDADVPQPVIQALRRGLAPFPEDRWTSIDDLLTVLGDQLRERSGFRVAYVAIPVVFGMSLVAGMAATPSPPGCEDTTRAGRSLWDSERASEVQTAFEAVRGTYALGAWRTVDARMTKFVEDWVQVRSNVCESRHSSSPARASDRDLELACLRDARVRARALVDVLSKADRSVVSRTNIILQELRDPAACADGEALRTGVRPPPGESAERVLLARETLADARALLGAGKFDEALSAALHAREAGRHVAYAPLSTELDLVTGQIHGALGDYHAAGRLLADALLEGLAENQWPEAARAANSLVSVVGYRLSNTTQGMVYARLARALTSRVHGSESVEYASALMNEAIVLQQSGDYQGSEPRFREAVTMLEGSEDELRLANALHNLGAVQRHLGRYDEARVAVERALTIRTEGLGREHPSTVSTLANLAGLTLQEGHHTRALELAEEVLEIQTRLLGPLHPEVGGAHSELGLVLTEVGRVDEALEHYQAARRIAEQSFGSDHPQVAIILNNVAQAHGAAGRFEEAATTYQEAAEIWEAAHGRFHPDVALARSNLGLALHQLERHEEAQAHLRDALEIRGQLLGPDHPRVGYSTLNLALVLEALGKSEEALAGVFAARDNLLRSLGPDHPALAEIHHVIGTFMTSRGRFEEARESLEQAWEMRKTDADTDRRKAQTAFALAMALTRPERVSPEERRRAHELARHAQTILENLGDDETRLYEELIGWLDQHR